MFTGAVIKCSLRKLMDMTTIKTAVGLLYRQSDAEICKELKIELTNRCPVIEIRADVAVEYVRGLPVLDP